MPDQELLDQAMAQVGQQHLHIDDGQLCKDVPLTVDFSSIGAGYMVDRVAERLEHYGIKSSMVELTGELKAVGRKPGDRPWRIAVDEPRMTIAWLRLSWRWTVSRCRLRRLSQLLRTGWQRYSHTFDARTGRPVMHRLAAVTVLDDSAARADGLSTC
ncbi:FAD:protein FMN transferase [Halopseudomonas pachastrellae]|nr:FAD:protein FMN transferase [Halopseudomonas pachastrellae]